MSIVYLLSGCDKLDWHWISGQLVRELFLKKSPIKRMMPEPLVVLAKLPAFEPAFMVAACAVALTELALALLLWNPRWRTRAVAVGIVLHFGMTLLCGKVSGFTDWSCICLLACLDDGELPLIMRRVRPEVLFLAGWIVVRFAEQ
eukprot:gnl/TRDRNA2_/TRDRNA2_168990_c0_seq9.p3 gnl/TRDRNA2_/TRDRNA2_168990_c0~~gnl/TRDRNA2_/TRDRNA2_168990_c0_seq9.p3  ORF type:complete len:145 (-),score=16.50 gnl/TRDRNA2_/TRDRNA2_168990_c0_seq9:65-499(-)